MKERKIQKISEKNIITIQLSQWAPEQYEVILKKTRQLIGYIRLRCGRLTADVPSSNGALVYTFGFDDELRDQVKGCFESGDEREKYLKLCISAIIENYNKYGKVGARVESGDYTVVEVKWNKEGKIENNVQLTPDLTGKEIRGLANLLRVNLE